MEKSAIRIVGQSPLGGFQFTGRNGEQVYVKTKELVFSDGIDTFVAEALDQLAEKLDREPLPDGSIVSLQCTLDIRRWTSKETQQEMRANRVRILKIAAV